MAQRSGDSADRAAADGERGAETAGMHGACDAHCHLDFAANPAALAQTLAREGRSALSCTVEPAGYLHAADALSAFPNVRTGLGLHPWWVAADAETAADQAERFEALAAAADFIGEVGLDFAPRRVSTADAQRAVFTRTVRASVAAGGKALSIHAVRSAGAVLDVLGREGAFDRCCCILHWFSGSSDELQRAIKSGCWFSVGERMLASKRGRVYAAAIPADRLLLETDLPDRDNPGSAAELTASLDRAFAALADVRGAAVAEAAASANVRALFA